MRGEDSGSRNLPYERHSTTRNTLGRPLAGFLAALLTFATLGAPLPAGANAAIIVTRISQAAGGGDANGPSSEVSISADGSLVAFASRASDIVAGDTGGKSDVFLYDSGSGATTRVSVHSNGTAGNDHSGTPVISADGSTIAYSSTATNLVDGDLNGRRDVFVYDVATKQTTRISVATGGAEGDEDSSNPSISDDGQKIAFSSEATNLVVGDTNGVGDVFLHDNGVTTRVSVATSGSQASDNSGGPAISGDGTTIAFYSFADDLVADDTRAVQPTSSYAKPASPPGSRLQTTVRKRTGSVGVRRSRRTAISSHTPRRPQTSSRGTPTDPSMCSSTTEPPG